LRVPHSELQSSSETGHTITKAVMNFALWFYYCKKRCQF